jgi:hypothetical protein
MLNSNKEDLCLCCPDVHIIPPTIDPDIFSYTIDTDPLVITLPDFGIEESCSDEIEWTYSAVLVD